jgi:FecR protein
MKRSILCVVFLVVAALFAPSFADSIAKVVAIVGAPSASGPGGNRPLAANSAIFEHDKITVSSGNAQILFNDGTRLVVGPASTLVIEKYLMRGGSTAQKLSINALRGTFRFITGNSAKNAYDIKTANATIGIRGTGFDFWVQRNTGVAVHVGKVKLANAKNKSSFINIDAGCQVGITDPTKSELLKGNAQVSNILRKLPYAVDQRNLTQRFRLNINACRNLVSNAEQPNQHQCTPQCHQECSFQTAGASNCHDVCTGCP